jgi:hypothetical protein
LGVDREEQFQLAFQKGKKTERTIPVAVAAHALSSTNLGGSARISRAHACLI